MSVLDHEPAKGLSKAVLYEVPRIGRCLTDRA